MKAARPFPACDRLSSWLTGLCVVHCLTLPLVLALFPALFASRFAHGAAERYVLTGAIGFAAVSLCWGYRTHKKLRAASLWTAACMWFTFATLTHHHLPFTLLGGGCLAASQYVNRRLCKSCLSCNHAKEKQK
jgi:hypothetical protein